MMYALQIKVKETRKTYFREDTQSTRIIWAFCSPTHLFWWVLSDEIHMKLITRPLSDAEKNELHVQIALGTIPDYSPHIQDHLHITSGVCQWQIIEYRKVIS